MNKSHISWETLLAWWLGELPEAEEAPLEEHLFSCAHCTRRGEELAALGAGVREALRSGKVGAYISKGFLERMRAAGMRLREYSVEPGGRVQCTLGAGDDAVVARARASLAGVKRLDALQRVEVGGQVVMQGRIEDVPFDPAAGEVLFVPLPAALRKTPQHTATLRFVAVEEGGEREIGEYTFAHTPG